MVDRQNDAPNQDPSIPLHTLAAIARRASVPAVESDALALAERVEENRFYVAVMGQFKRGKSTLINALIGETILPTGVVPVTAVVTVVRHGSQHCRIRMIDGQWQEIDLKDLVDFVSEEKNPGNTKGVRSIEVFFPSPLLATGMCLVDTPGLGSVFVGGTTATHEFVPHVDAAVIVLGADPPISEDELRLTENVAQKVKDILFVLNKADRVPDGDRKAVLEFTRRVLEKQLSGRSISVHEVSAVEKTRGTWSLDWKALILALEHLAREAGSMLVRDAARRGIERLTGQLLHELEEERGALVRPVEESEERIGRLRQCATEAERSMNDLAYLFTGEEVRLGNELAARKEAFLQRTREDAQRELREALHALRDRSLREQAILLAQDICQRWLDRWRVEEQPAAESLYQRAAERFVELANWFLDRLAALGDPALASLPRQVQMDLGFRVKSRLAYTPLWQHTSNSPFLWLLDRIRSRNSLLRSIERETATYFDALLYTNSTRIENDFRERVLESRRLLESEIRHHLREIYASAERALSRMRATAHEGSEAVQRELKRLDGLTGDISNFKACTLDKQLMP